MNVDLVLLLLRLLGAGLLLAFMGVFAWLIYRDLTVTSSHVSRRQAAHGYLRVMESTVESAPVDTLFPLRPLTSIGRAGSNTIVLDDGYTSGKHALLTLRGQQWWLEDLDSRNGTLLNEIPLMETAVISAGDIVTVGNTRLKVEF